MTDPDPDPELLAALDLAVRLSGVARYRYLCLEHPDPAVREGYRGHVRRIAAGVPPIRVDYGTRPPGSCCG